MLPATRRPRPANVVANSGLVRMGVVAHLLDGTFFVFLAMTLYILLQHVHKSVARAMLVLVALATGIICLNAVFQFEGLRVATDSTLCGRLRYRGFECPGAALARHPALWDPHRAGLLWPVAGAAGVSRLQIGGCSPSGSASCSSWAASATLWTCSRRSWSRTFGQKIHVFVVIPPTIAEISMVLYLLVIGVKTVKPIERVSA